MFVHSVKVPKLYKQAAGILQKVKENGDNAKTLIFSANHRNKKAIYALVIQTLQNLSSIETLIGKVKLLEKERINPWLARILIQELLWGKKVLPGESLPLKTILNYQTKLENHASKLSKPTSTQTKKVNKPRAVRVNTIVTTLNKVVTELRNEDWRLLPFAGKTYEEFVSQIALLKENEFMVDIHFKELLQFPSNAAFSNYKGYKDGSLVLQDKASCLPTYLLNPEPGSTILDMCAAPGMKTTHLAALTNNKGTIYAVERDSKRFEILNKMVTKSKATSIKTINSDVLQLSAKDCPNVKYILVDPSCTGSGMTDRLDVNEDPASIKERLQKLSGFQIMILKHALKNFPHAQRVVYSTCSIYPEENEYVVKEVLQTKHNFKLVNANQLLQNSWKSSNYNEEWKGISENCVAMKPESDLTNGFFVAVFERTGGNTKGKTTPKKGKNKKMGKDAEDTKTPKKHKTTDNELNESKKNKIQLLDSVNVHLANEVLQDIKEKINK